ncbi:hypothetical protein LCGC14_0681220 [marine sediment metagenome]|uniref:Norphogenetic protein n=1 Tax=marine sediment metagenome TaxID=412755 RepID=A0A0F9R8E1_9ZZZZ
MQWQVPRIWQGKEVYIVGGGPSIEKLKVAELSGKRIIVANNSYRLFPDAHYCFFMDYHEWYVHHKKELRETFKGNLVSCHHKFQQDPDVLYLASNGSKGLTRKPGGITNGNNSGTAAINLAFLLGATTIILIGFDMRMVDGSHNYHNECFRTKSVPEDIYKSSFIPNLATMAVELEKEGISVQNATPGSALDLFPFRHDLIEALYDE